MDKRKSSFKYGRRRSRSLGGILTVKEICKTFRKSFPSSQKLQLLFLYAMENSLSTAEKDLCEDKVTNAFTKSISECLVEADTECEEHNYYSLAVEEDELTNDHISLNEKYAEYSAAVARFDDENKQWDELLTKYRTNLENEINLESMQFEGSFDKQNYQHLDYSDILKDVEKIDDNINIQIGKLKRSSCHLSSYVKLTNRGISALNRKAGKNYLKTFQESPRTLIRKCF